MLCVVGDLREDIVTVFESDPARGAATPASIHTRRGGAAANIAAFAADAGKPTRFVGHVGSDHTGDRLVAQLAEKGVETVVSQRGRTGRAVVLVGPGAQSSSLVDPGATSQLIDIDHAVLDDVTLLHLPGFVFGEDPLATEVGELVGEALHRGIAISIGSQSVAELETFGVEEFLSLIATVRPAVLFANRSEAALLAGPRAPVVGADITVITSGARPTVLAWPNGASRSIEVEPVERPLDSTGVGDAFVAGFLIASMDRLTAATATKAGHLLAGQVLAHYGADLVAKGSR